MRVTFGAAAIAAAALPAAAGMTSAIWPTEPGTAQVVVLGIDP